MKNDQPDPDGGPWEGGSGQLFRGVAIPLTVLEFISKMTSGEVSQSRRGEGGSGQLLRGVAIPLTVLEFISEMTRSATGGGGGRRVVRLLRPVAHSR